MSRLTRSRILASICLILSVSWAVAPSASALDNGLASTPPMGWLAWERFTCETDCASYPDQCINDQLFRSMAQRMVDDGYFAAGYEYVNIDDCWSEKRRHKRSFQLRPNQERFPYGIGELAGYVHSKGLKLGLYGDCGTATCANYPAQLKSESDLEDNYFDMDARSLAEWKVDSFKFDGCNLAPSKAESICPSMATALNATGRPILLVCEWPFYMLRENRDPDYALASKSCNAWRYYEDVEDSWDSILAIVDFTIKHQAKIVRYHGPGGWFDPDQLVIGNFGLSLAQARAQMALWAVWSAPLYMSNDLREITSEEAAILKNRNLIEVNQDRMGVFGLMVASANNGLWQAFVKPVVDIRNGCPSFVVVYLSRETMGNYKRLSFRVRDLLSKSAIDVAASRYNSALDSGSKSGGKFDAQVCLKRLTRSMTVDPTTLPRGLVVDQPGTPAEQQIVNYKLTDLITSEELPELLSLNATLDLDVEPSGVRVVKLVEVM